ncbi:MAG: hypothetical protein E7604_03320 [Ruminococcaceae bacterium]|nr:hypothetical protein [Oscillospiraceae bacterium]
MIQKALKAPVWLTSGSVYQINPRTFSPEGTITAITKELPYLASLGISTIYLCPIFEADASENRENWSVRQKKYGTENPKNPYRMNDYYRIDEEYGTLDDLAECIRETHRCGMRLILDLVYLHIGPNAPILKTHPEFAKQNADGSFINGYWNFPLLDFNHRGLREYLYGNMIYYIAVLDCDGFRCDVGDGVPLDFWVEGRQRICSVKPDAILINEGRRGETLLAGFHAIYGYDWHACIYNIVADGKSAEELKTCWEKTNVDFPRGAVILRDLENHDTVTDWPARLEVSAGHTCMDLITALNLVVDGAPMLYCGNELCDTTTVNMFANRFHPGIYSATPRSEDMKNTPQAQRRQHIIRTLNALRREDALLREGDVEWLDHDCTEHAIAFRRVLGDRSILFVGNLRGEAVCLTLPGITTADVIVSGGASECASGKFTLEPYGFAVLWEQ